MYNVLSELNLYDTNNLSQCASSLCVHLVLLAHCALKISQSNLQNKIGGISLLTSKSLTMTLSVILIGPPCKDGNARCKTGLFIYFRKLIIFNCNFCTKVTYGMQNSSSEKHIRIMRITHFKALKQFFWSSIKVSRLALWIGPCHFCMEGHLKLRVQSL